MERSYFYDSTDTDKRIYQAADFARFHGQIIGNGVSNAPNLPNLAVEAKENMTISLGAGYCFANGYMYENTAALNLTHDTAHTTYDRIDRIVIRFDNNPAERKVYAYIKKGTPNSSPVAPSLQRDDYVYEMSVAQVRIIAGKSYIEQYQITDERTNDSVCGYIPLHNIYRGLEINQTGMVTMPNQSYVEVYNKNSINFAANTDQVIDFGTPVMDRQGEVKGDQFTAKASGVYAFYLLVNFDGSIPSTVDMQASILINGTDRVFLFARPGTGGLDNNFLGFAFKYLNEGDDVVFHLHTMNATVTYTTTYVRISIAKIS